MYSSSEDSVRTRKQEAAGDVSMQDKEQTEETETGALSQEAADRSNRDKQQTTQQVGSRHWGTPAAVVRAAEQRELRGSAPKLVLQLCFAK